jgi:hypothetical protein
MAMAVFLGNKIMENKIMKGATAPSRDGVTG